MFNIKFTKRAEIKKSISITVRLIAIAVAIAIAGLFLLVMKHDPIEVFGAYFGSAFGSVDKFADTIERTIPLLILSLGILIAFKMQFISIGAEGQMLMGAFGAALLALNFPNMNKPVLLILMMLLGAIMGGITCLIAGLLKTYFKTNETIVTLMLNYVALQFITYLQYDAWKDPLAMGFPKIPNFVRNAVLPKVLGVNIGWIISIVLVIFVYIFFKKSKKGYEIEVIGESEKTAKYAGINIKGTMLLGVFISGAFCGLAGAIQASAVSRTLSTAVTGGLGYTAIIVAYLSNLSAPVAAIVSVLFASMLQWANHIQTAFQVPNAVAQVLQGLILFAVLGSEFFVKYKLSIKKEVK